MKLEPRTTPTVLILLLLAMPAGALAQDPADAGVEPDETAEPDLEGDGGILDEDPMGEAQTEAGPTEPEAEPASPAVEEAPVTPPPAAEEEKKPERTPVNIRGTETFVAEYVGDNGTANEATYGDDDDYWSFRNILYVQAGNKFFDSAIRLDMKPLPERAGPGELRRVRLGRRGRRLHHPRLRQRLPGGAHPRHGAHGQAQAHRGATATSTSAGASPCPSSSSTTRARTTPCAAAGLSTGCPASSSWCSWAAW